MNDQLSEAFREFGAGVAQMVTAIGKVVRALIDGCIDVEFALAYAWATGAHPEWVCILNRTKKKRIRKKYQDRILREYRKSKEAEA